MPLVIFVDDSETALASTRMVTNSMPIEVKQYTEAQVALAEIQAGMTPDLIITDLNMPVMNGLEFVEALRKVASTSRTPCLMLTTETKAELKDQPTETIAIIAALNIAYDLSVEKNKFREFSIQATDKIKKIKLLLDKSEIESIPS